MKKILLFILCAAFSVKMQAQCSASFTYTSNPSGTYTFVANSNNSPSTIYQWTFGNGTAGYGQTVTTQYNFTGTAMVCLTVTDTFSTCVDTSCQSISVGGSGSSCNANFTYSVANGGASLNSTSTGQGTMSYAWYEGTNVFSTSSSAQYSNNPGTYNICLAISDGNGCSDTLCQAITIPNPASCQANFYIYPDSNGAPHTYIGVNTSTGVGNAGSYLWIWGDGTTSTGAYPSHTYPAAGIYNICLVIGNPATGCVDSFCVSSTINKNSAMYTITFAAPAAIPTVETLHASLFPNPVKNSISISDLKAGLYQVEIFNLQGSKVLQSQVANNGTILLSTLSKGMYAIKISDNEGRTTTKKFIKE